MLRTLPWGWTGGGRAAPGAFKRPKLVRPAEREGEKLAASAVRRGWHQARARLGELGAKGG